MLMIIFSYELDFLSARNKIKSVCKFGEMLAHSEQDLRFLHSATIDLPLSQ